MYILSDPQGLADLLPTLQNTSINIIVCQHTIGKDMYLLITHLMGAEVSPSSHHCLGGLMYMHHSSQLKPWPEFS